MSMMFKAAKASAKTHGVSSYVSSSWRTSRVEAVILMKSRPARRQLQLFLLVYMHLLSRIIVSHE